MLSNGSSVNEKSTASSVTALVGKRADLAAQCVPALGHAGRVGTQAKPLRRPVVLLVGDEEDVVSILHAVQHVQPVVRVAFEDFERGVDAGVGGQDLLDLVGSRLLGQEVRSSPGGVGAADGQPRRGPLAPNCGAQGRDVL